MLSVETVTGEGKCEVFIWHQWSLYIFVTNPPQWAGQVISSLQRPLLENITLTTDKHPCPPYPQSQQASSRRPTP